MAGERILIVEDDPATLRLLAALLETEGYRVGRAGDADEALAALGLGPAAAAAEPPYALVLLDIALPRTDGIEVCRRIKASPALGDLPVIFVTASAADSTQMEQAFAAGAHDFLTKPTHRVELLARVSAALRLKEELDRRRVQQRDLEEATHELERANSQLRELAAVDAVTGIANRRRFDERLEWEWRRAARSGAAMSVILIDVDHFKDYNDAYGHQAGDECLRHVAAALAGATQRATDLVARYGGEEFVVVLGQTDEAGALALAEQLRAKLDAIKVPHKAAPLGHLTISLGVATTTPSSAWSISWSDLLGAADAALYRAKGDGRNRVCVAPALGPR